MADIPDWLKGSYARFGTAPPTNVDPRLGQAPAHGLDDKSRHLLEQALPRGLPFGRDEQNRSERAAWAGPDEIRTLRWKAGDIVLGTFNGGLLGYMDDRPMVTVASARSGKSSTVIEPTLLTYPGSALVLDPKGELASKTAQHRRDVLGQQVYVVDPFGCSALPSSSFNALAELDVSSAEAVEDADTVAQALILQEGRGQDGDYWTASAQFLLRGLILYTLRLPPAERHLGTVRELLTLNYPPLRQAAAEAERAKERSSEQGTRAGASDIAQEMLFLAMADASDAFDGALAAVGQSFLRKPSRERGGIIGTAETQTRFLDSGRLKAIAKTSEFRLAGLAEAPATIYLCLPAGRMETHFRWLRLIVQQALSALERRGTWPRDKLPILFLMEEFASLGHMPAMEQAAAYFPGFGVKLWAVVQDLAQLKRHYRDSWETFLSNTGLVQFFATSGETTNGYLSARVGMTSFALKGQSVEEVAGEAAHKERLIYPHELEKVFSRESGAQGLVVAGRAPIAALRLTHEEVQSLKAARRS